jgi:hypothetical protein
MLVLAPEGIGKTWQAQPSRGHEPDSEYWARAGIETENSFSAVFGGLNNHNPPSSFHNSAVSLCHAGSNGPTRIVFASLRQPMNVLKLK